MKFFLHIYRYAWHCIDSFIMVVHTHIHTYMCDIVHTYVYRREQETSGFLVSVQQVTHSLFLLSHWSPSHPFSHHSPAVGGSISIAWLSPIGYSMTEGTPFVVNNFMLSIDSGCCMAAMETVYVIHRIFPNMEVYIGRHMHGLLIGDCRCTAVSITTVVES